MFLFKPPLGLLVLSEDRKKLTSVVELKVLRRDHRARLLFAYFLVYLPSKRFNSWSDGPRGLLSVRSAPIFNTAHDPLL